MSQYRFTNPKPSFPQYETDRLISYPDVNPILFLSDVHLGAFSREINKKLESELIALLNFCQRNDYRLILLGDLFDYWMEYKSWHPTLGRHLLAAFRNHHNHAEPTLYITGNHDHWHLNYLEEIGFEIENEFRILQFQNKQAIMLHGDGLADPHFQLPRSFFNRLLRSHLFIRLFRTLLPPRSGLTIMKYISKFNKWMESEEKAQKKSILSDWASHLLDQSTIDAVICGHNHNPEILSFNSGTYLNPGAYGLQRTLGLYTNHQFSLVKWDVSNQNLVSAAKNQYS